MKNGRRLPVSPCAGGAISPLVAYAVLAAPRQQQPYCPSQSRQPPGLPDLGGQKVIRTPGSPEHGRHCGSHAPLRGSTFAFFSNRAELRRHLFATSSSASANIGERGAKGGEGNSHGPFLHAGRMRVVGRVPRDRYRADVAVRHPAPGSGCRRTGWMRQLGPDGLSGIQRLEASPLAQSQLIAVGLRRAGSSSTPDDVRSCLRAHSATPASSLEIEALRRSIGRTDAAQGASVAAAETAIWQVEQWIKGRGRTPAMEMPGWAALYSKLWCDPRIGASARARRTMFAMVPLMRETAVLRPWGWRLRAGRSGERRRRCASGATGVLGNRSHRLSDSGDLPSRGPVKLIGSPRQLASASRWFAPGVETGKA